MGLFKCDIPKDAYRERFVKITKGEKGWYEHQQYCKDWPGKHGTWHWRTIAKFKNKKQMHQYRQPKVVTEID